MMQAMRNASEVSCAVLVEIELGGLTDSKFNEYPEPHPAYIQILRLVLAILLVGAPEHGTTYNGDTNG